MTRKTNTIKIAPRPPASSMLYLNSIKKKKKQLNEFTKKDNSANVFTCLVLLQLKVFGEFYAENILDTYF